jgi:hypothetical protein
MRPAVWHGYWLAVGLAGCVVPVRQHGSVLVACVGVTRSGDMGHMCPCIGVTWWLIVVVEWWPQHICALQ